MKYYCGRKINVVKNPQSLRASSFKKEQNRLSLFLKRVAESREILKFSVTSCQLL
jgi:hypothetical protein